MLLLLLTAALALKACIALVILTGTGLGSFDSSNWGRSTSTAEEKEEQSTFSKSETQQLRRDFVTLRDVELVATAAARAAVGLVKKSTSATFLYFVPGSSN